MIASELLTLKQVGIILKVGRHILKRLHESGQLKSINVGISSAKRYKREDVSKFMLKNRGKLLLI